MNSKLPSSIVTNIFACSAIIIVGIFVFSNSLSNGFVYDDLSLVEGNPIIRSLSNIPSFFTGGTYVSFTSDSPAGFHYQPIVTTIYSLINNILGNEPFFFHLTQLLFFIFSVVLVYFVFRKFIDNTFALLFSLFFLVHPINQEMAAYISNTQDTLFFFFGMLALVITMYKSNWFIVTGLSLFLSALSKETGLLFVILVPFYHYLFRTGKALIHAGVSGVILSFYFFLRFGVADLAHGVQSHSPMADTPLWTRLLNIPPIIDNYFATVIFPKDIVTSEAWIVTDITIGNFYLPLILIIIYLFGFIYFGYRIYYQESKRLLNAYIFFCAVLGLGLTLHLQIIPLDGTIANRWFYMSAFGLFGALAIISKTLYTHYLFSKKITYILLSIFLIVISALSLRTMERNTNWKNTLTLMEHDTSVTTDNFSLENMYGYELMMKGRLNEAKYRLEKSITLAPNESQNRNNLGVLHSMLGNIPLAKENYKKSIINGDYYFAYDNLATLYALEEDFVSAKELAEEGLNKFPKGGHLWLVLAVVEDKLGNYDSSLSAVRKAHEIMPTNMTSKAYSNVLNRLPLDISLLQHR